MCSIKEYYIRIYTGSYMNEDSKNEFFKTVQNIIVIYGVKYYS